MLLILLDIYGCSTTLNVDSAILKNSGCFRCTSFSTPSTQRIGKCCTLEVMFGHSFYSLSLMRSFKKKHVENYLIILFEILVPLKSLLSLPHTQL